VPIPRSDIAAGWRSERPGADAGRPAYERKVGAVVSQVSTADSSEGPWRAISLVVECSARVAGEQPTPSPNRGSLIERRVQRIANARSATWGLAVSFVGLAFVGAVVIRIADPHDFHSLGLAFWWALQTVTTVGYGDVVPTTRVGQVIGGLEMVIGVSFIAFLTAGVTSVVIQRGQAGTAVADEAQRKRDTQAIIDAVSELKDLMTDLDARVEVIGSKITK
jgi:voltage-gated potassium channel